MVHLVSELSVRRLAHWGCCIGNHERVRILAYYDVSSGSIYTICQYLDSHLEAELADGFAVLAGLLRLVSTELRSKEGQPARLTGLAAGFVSSI